MHLTKEALVFTVPNPDRLGFFVSSIQKRSEKEKNQTVDGGVWRYCQLLERV
jgi:hypothetical protein